MYWLYDRFIMEDEHRANEVRAQLQYVSQQQQLLCRVTNMLHFQMQLASTRGAVKRLLYIWQRTATGQQ